MPVKKQGTWPLYYLLLLYNVEHNPFPATSFLLSPHLHTPPQLRHTFTVCWILFFSSSLSFVFFCSFRFYFDDNFSCIDTFVYVWAWVWVCMRFQAPTVILLHFIGVISLFAWWHFHRCYETIDDKLGERGGLVGCVKWKCRRLWNDDWIHCYALLYYFVCEICRKANIAIFDTFDEYNMLPRSYFHSAVQIDCQLVFHTIDP